MNDSIKQQILDRIEAYDHIIISRHARPDGRARARDARDGAHAAGRAEAGAV